MDLIRVNSNMDTTSSDLGSYDTFECTGSGSNRSCSFTTESLNDYMEGVAFYGILNIIALVVLVLFVFGYFVYFVVILVLKRKAGRDEKHRHDSSPLLKTSQTTKSRLRTIRTGMLIFSLCSIFTLFMLNTFLGNYGLSEGSYTVVEAGDGAQHVIEGMEASTTGFTQRTGYSVISPFLATSNYTINEATDLPRSLGSFKRINETLPDLPDATAFLSHVIHILHRADNITQYTVSVMSKTHTFLWLEKRVYSLHSDLQSDINDHLDPLLQRMYSTLDSINNTYTEFRQQVVALVGDGHTGGSIRKAHTALADVQRAPEGSLPSVRTFKDAASGSYGTVSRMQAGKMDGEPEEVELLTGRLTAIHRNISRLPDMAALAESVLEINATVADIRSRDGLLNRLRETVRNFQQQIANIPPISVVSDRVDDILDIIHVILEQADDVVTILKDYLQLFNGVPDDIEKLAGFLDELGTAKRLLPHIGVIVSQLDGINHTIMELPGGLAHVSNNFVKFNKSATTLLDDRYGTVAKLNELNSTCARYLSVGNASIAPMTDALQDLNDTIHDYDLREIVSQLNDTVNSLRSIRFNQTLQFIDAVDDKLSAMDLSEDTIDWLYYCHDKIQLVSRYLGRTVDPTEGGKSGNSAGDYILLSQGYCDNDDSVYCKDDNDCTGDGVCTRKGKYRCAKEGKKSCTSDTQCQRYCLADSVVSTNILGGLQAFTTSKSSIDMGPVLEPLETVMEIGDMDFQTQEDRFHRAHDYVYSINTTSLKQALHRIKDLMDKINITEQVQYIEDAREEISEADIPSYIDVLEKYRSRTGEMKDRVADILADAIKKFEALNFFLFSNSQLSQRIRSLSRSSLATKLKASGPYDMIVYMAQQMDYMSLYFHNSEADFAVPLSNYSDMIPGQVHLLDKAGSYEGSGYYENNKHGSLFYLMKLFKPATLVDVDNPLARGVFVDSHGDTYANNTYCLSSSCIEHTVNVLNSEPLSNWNTELPVYVSAADGPVLSDTSRETLLLLLWIPVLCLLPIGGTLAVVGYAPKVSRLAKLRLSRCFTGCVSCHIPVILILTAIVFPLVVMVNDTCSTWSGVGDTYITTYGDDFCSNQFSGVGTLRDCRFNVSVPQVAGGGDISVSLDILAMYRGIFSHDCDSNPDAVANVVRSLAVQVQDIPTNAANEFISTTLSDYTLRPGSMTVINSTTENTGAALKSFLMASSANSLNCEALSSVISDVEYVTCDSIVEPILWIVGTWYLCAWVLVCCALPAGCGYSWEYSTKQKWAARKTSRAADSDSSHSDMDDTRSSGSQVGSDSSSVSNERTRSDAGVLSRISKNYRSLSEVILGCEYAVMRGHNEEACSDNKEVEMAQYDTDEEGTMLGSGTDISSNTDGDNDNGLLSRLSTKLHGVVGLLSGDVSAMLGRSMSHDNESRGSEVNADETTQSNNGFDNSDECVSVDNGRLSRLSSRLKGVANMFRGDYTDFNDDDDDNVVTHQEWVDPVSDRGQQRDHHTLDSKV